MCWTYSVSRVAWPRQRTRTQVASGSRVPVWPSLVPRGNQRWARSTASREVMPVGLSTTSSPSREEVRMSPSNSCRRQDILTRKNHHRGHREHREEQNQNGEIYLF